MDVVPFEGSWTPGLVGEHIIKSVSNLPAFLNKNTEPTSRPYDAQCAPLRKVFLDFTIKMKSPDFIIPSASHHDKDSILSTFSKLKMQMIEAVETLDLTLSCKSFELPGSGFLTRMEWLTFFVVHTKRHTHQLRKIYEVMSGQ